ncbi:MAG: heme ABC exporter ATP-binding protein CcmA [Burkholderiaceae bacterium]
MNETTGVSPGARPHGTTWSVHDLAARAGDRPLFAGVSIVVPPGHWVDLTGDNGVGKTTLLRLLAGLSRPDGGTIRLGERAIDARDPDWRANLLYIGHATALKAVLDARENLRSWMALDRGRPVPATEPAARLSEVGLARRAHVLADRLSAGQKKRVQMARMAANRAAIWLLDEPGNALDRDGQNLLQTLVDRHLAAGGSAVVASHHRLPIAAPSIGLDMNRHAVRRSRPASATGPASAAASATAPGPTGPAPGASDPGRREPGVSDPAPARTPP